MIRNGIDLPARRPSTRSATRLGAAGFATALFGKAHFASYFPDYPDRAASSRSSARRRCPADWHGPYFGFDHVELVTDVHNIRLAPARRATGTGASGRRRWGCTMRATCSATVASADSSALRLMQPEAAGRSWDDTQTWTNQLPEEDHPTTWVADRAVDWLGRVDRPFFAWVSFPDPHHPFDPPRPWCDRYDPADMAQVLPRGPSGRARGQARLPPQWAQGFRGTPCEWANPGWALLDEREQLTILAALLRHGAQLDHDIGRVLDALAARGLADDTLVIFTSDHGDFLGDHQMMLKGPIHYEALLRVPLVVRGPGFAPGRVVDDPVGTIDCCPTVLEACGLPIPATCEGRPLLDGPREWALTEDDMIRGRPRLPHPHDAALPPHARPCTIPSGGELYDLGDDPGELVEPLGRPGAADAVRGDLLALLDDVMRHDLGRELPQVCQAG